MRALFVLFLCCDVGSASPRLFQASSCVGDWERAFTGGNGQIDGLIYDMAVFDAGNDPLLYACGAFRNANGYRVDNLAQWDGNQWLPLQGGGMEKTVRALAVFDDGSGPALFAAGDFLLNENGVSSNLVRYDGTSWSTAGIQTGGQVNDLVVYDGGQGPELVIGGFFSSVRIDGTLMGNMNNLARWDGTNLRRLGGGTNQRINSLEVFDDGTGPSLYAAGRFTIAAPVTARGVARWDGANWHALGNGMGGPQWGGELESYDAGGGSELYVSREGFAALNSIFRWDGAAWTSLDCGVGCPVEVDGTVSALLSYDDGSSVGEALYVGGSDLNVGTLTDQNALRWDGSQWSTVGTGTGVPIRAFATYDDGQGLRLCAGGGVSQTNSGLYDEFAVWDGGSWSLPAQPGLQANVNALRVHDDGSGGGDELYLGGSFTNATAVPDSYIAKWNGTSYSAVGGGFNRTVHDLIEFDDGQGGGPDLYAAGEFTMAGGQPANRVAKWDGSTWAPLGSGLDGRCYALAGYDDGQGGGPILFAGGEFNNADGAPASNLARWDGSQWTAVVGGGVSSWGEVLALTVHDDGTGPALFVGGRFGDVGGVSARSLARWDGTTWQDLGGGIDSPSSIFCFESYNDGTGDRLLVGGNFDTVGSLPIRRLAAWDGSTWSAIGGPGPALARNVLDIHVTLPVPGLPPRIYVAADSALSSVNAPFLLRFDGSSWETLGAGIQLRGRAVTSYQVDAKPAIVVGGLLPATPAGDAHVALWRPCALLEDLCFGDGGNGAGCTPCPCGNDAAPGTRGGCLNSLSRGASLTGSGSTGVLSGDLRFELAGASPNSVALLLSGPAALPVMGVCPAGTGVPSPVFDGLRCVGPGIARHGSRPTDASGQAGDSTPGWGPPDGPMGGLALQSGFMSGQMRYFQTVYRDDPAAQCGTGINTTNAVRVTFR